MTCVKNFPDSRGVVLMILKGFIGLSGVVYKQLYLALYGGEDVESLILLMRGFTLRCLSCLSTP